MWCANMLGDFRRYFEKDLVTSLSICIGVVQQRPGEMAYLPDAMKIRGLD